MAPDNRAIDHVSFVVGQVLGQSRRHGLPDARLAPAPEAPPDAVPIAISLGHVAPRRAGAQPPEDAVDGGAPVDRRTTAAILRRKQILQNLPLGFSQITSTQDCLLPNLQS